MIRCAETLRELGHDAFFWCGRHSYTWHRTAVPMIPGKVHPECDVSIATGHRSYKHTANSGYFPVAYNRVMEYWNAPEKELIAAHRRMRCVFVNSEWLYQYLGSFGVPVVLQYPGIDPDVFYDTGLPRSGVGALVHWHKRKRASDVVALERKLGFDFMCVNRDVRGNSAELNARFNGLKVWFAPTELEGLHNPPIEAGMAGCALVCTDHPRGGMLDYAIDGETALLYPARDLEAAATCVRTLLGDESKRRRLNRNMVELLRVKFGTRLERMAEFGERLKSLVRPVGV